MNSLAAAKYVLAVAQTLWGTSYVMDASGAIWPVSGNGPHFGTFSEAIAAMQDHIFHERAAELLDAIGEEEKQY